MKHYNVWADTEGEFEKDSREINWTVSWVKDLVTDTSQIDEIIEVVVTKDGEEDVLYYDDHKQELDDEVIAAAYKAGEPEFDESATWTDIQECFAEQEVEE